MSKQETTRPIHFIVYGRTACHLCEDMLLALDELASEYEFSVEFRDIDSNPAWFDQFALKIPVLMQADEEICHYHLDLAAFRSRFGGQADRL